MTEQAIAIEPKAKLNRLTLSKETVRQLTGRQTGEANGREEGRGTCNNTRNCSHKCLTTLGYSCGLCSF